MTYNRYKQYVIQLNCCCK